MSEEPDVGRPQEPIMAKVRIQEPIMKVPGVDAHLFGISMDVPFDNISVTNLVHDDVLEGEDVNVINVDGFDSDPGEDDEISNYKKRRLAELSREIEGVINASGQQKRNLKLYNNDSVRIRARCDGKVPVFTMSQEKMVGSTMRIPLLYRGEYSQWRERFMNYLEEQTDGEAMINSIQNGNQPLPVIAKVSLAGNTQNTPPTLKDLKFWTAEEKKNRKIDRLARSLLIQGLSNDIYSLIDSNETAKDLWDALERQMRGSKYGDKIGKLQFCMNMRLSKLLKESKWKQYGTLMRQTKNLMDINIDALYNILKQNQGDVNDALGYKKKAVVITSDPLALVAEKTKVSKRKEKVVVSSDSEGSGEDDFSELKKITTLLAKAFNRRKFCSKPTNNNLRTSSTSQFANKKTRVCQEGHFSKDCKKAKVKDYNYYKIKMLLAKKDSDEQVLLAGDQAWMESSSDSDQEINANMVFMAQIEKVLSDSDESSSSAEETIIEKHIEKANQQSKDLENQNKDLQEKDDVLINQVNTFEVQNNKFNEQMKVLNEKNTDFLNQIEVLQDQLKIKHVVNDTHTEYLDTFSSVRRPKHSIVIWKKKGSSNTSNVDLSSVSHSKLNKDSQRLVVMLGDSFDENNLCIFDDESVRISPVNNMPFRKKPCNSLNIVQICLWILNSGCSKYVTGNRALLTNFVEKFLGTVLEVAFRKSTCFVRNEYGVDFLTGDRSLNLYTIALNEVASNSSTFLLVKASSSQSWLWHQRLSHLNFATINNLVKNNLVQGLPKMKFKKDHLCSACEQGKIHQKHHKSKTAFASNKPLYLLHMDLCGPMRKTQVNLQLQVHRVRTDNGTEFKNKTLAKFFDEDVGKLKAKGDIGVFVGYSKESVAFRIYNKRTQVFHESSESFQEESSSSSLNDDVQKSLEKVGVPSSNTQSISNNMIPNVDEASTSHNVLNERLKDAYFDASTLFHDPSNVHTFYQPYPHEKK
nr:hypothetical protein [Tanacetum cinerariifolium]